MTRLELQQIIVFIIDYWADYFVNYWINRLVVKMSKTCWFYLTNSFENKTLKLSVT